MLKCLGYVTGLKQISYLSNVKKSNYIIFKTRQRREEFDLKIEILGVILDENLSQKPHLTYNLPVKFLNLLVLLEDQVLVSLSLP